MKVLMLLEAAGFKVRVRTNETRRCSNRLVVEVQKNNLWVRAGGRQGRMVRSFAPDECNKACKVACDVARSHFDAEMLINSDTALEGLGDLVPEYAAAEN